MNIGVPIRGPVTRPCSSTATGKKKSRCRTVWVTTNAPYRPSDTTAANASCDVVYSRPGSVTVNPAAPGTPGQGYHRCEAEPEPEALNDTSRWCSAPVSSETPTMPFRVIITAANTVSRA